MTDPSPELIAQMREAINTEFTDGAPMHPAKPTRCAQVAQDALDAQAADFQATRTSDQWGVRVLVDEVSRLEAAAITAEAKCADLIAAARDALIEARELDGNQDRRHRVIDAALAAIETSMASVPASDGNHD